MSELTNFLLARIADDEAAADEHHVDTCEFNPPGFPCDCGYPARVLAECAAKRTIVGLHDAIGSEVRNLAGTPAASLALARQSAIDVALRALAGVYAGEPGWREEWE